MDLVARPTWRKHAFETNRKHCPRVYRYRAKRTFIATTTVFAATQLYTLQRLAQAAVTKINISYYHVPRVCVPIHTTIIYQQTASASAVRVKVLHFFPSPPRPRDRPRDAQVTFTRVSVRVTARFRRRPEVRKRILYTTSTYLYILL